MILNFIMVMWKRKKSHGFFSVMNDYARKEAFTMDIYANQSFDTLWNTLLRKSGGYSFGKQGETISSALGKNKRDNTLSFLGKALCNLLDFIDENHCLDAINDNI